jgi:hypothetical protein
VRGGLFLVLCLWIISDDFRWVVRTEGVIGGVLRKDLFGFSDPVGYSNPICEGRDESLKFCEDY